MESRHVPKVLAFEFFSKPKVLHPSELRLLETKAELGQLKSGLYRHVYSLGLLSFSSMLTRRSTMVPSSPTVQSALMTGVIVGKPKLPGGLRISSPS